MSKSTYGEIFCKKRWAYLFLSMAIMLCLGTVYSWSVFRKPLEELFHIGFTQSGLPYMLSLAVYSVFMLLSGRYVNQCNPRIVITIGAILIGFGWLLSSFATNIYVLTITYGGIIGAGVGIAYGVPMHVIAKLFPERKGFAVGLVLTGFGLSPLVTAPLATYLIDHYGMRKTFWILGISFGVILPILAYPFQYMKFVNNNKTENLSNILDFKNETKTVDMIKSNNFRLLYFNFVIGTMIGLMFIGITSNVGIKLIKTSPGKVTLLISFFAIFNAMGRPVFGWITDKFSTRKAIWISYLFIFTAAIMMLLAKEGSLILYIIAFSIFWFNLGGWLAIAPTSTLAMFGTKYYSQNFGVMFTAYGIGAIIGVLVSGFLVDSFRNYDVIFYFVMVLCIVGILSSKFVKVETTLR